jgi:UDP-N-acetylmuramoyl-tripeptide--D-alanyl-D-alanine ligase
VVRVALEDDPVGGSRTRALPPPDRVGRLESGGDSAGEPQWLRLEGGSGEERIPLPLAGRHNARNLLLAVAVAEELGVKPEALAALEVELPGGRGRRQRLQGVEVLDETYNASPEAMLAALDLLASGAGRRFAALGTMLELGEQSLELHRRVAVRAAELGLEGLVIVDGGGEGEAMLLAASGLARCVRVSTPEEAAIPLLKWLEPGDRLLIKASRGVALERLIPLLERGLAERVSPPAPKTGSPG